MPIGNSIATLTSNVNFLRSATNRAIVKPEDFEGIAGFVFDITNKDDISLTSEITDHFIEDNTVINDHIALRPEIITVEGLVGELKLDIPPLLRALSDLNDKLTGFSGFLPELTAQTNEIYNQAEQILRTKEQAEQTIENLHNTFRGLDVAPKETLQSKAFSYFYSLWQSRRIFTVETPWNTFTNMAILNMKVKQEDTKYISNFSMTFKKIRFAKAIKIENSQGRHSEQISDVQNKGRVKGEEVDQSLLLTIYKKFFPS